MTDLKSTTILAYDNLEKYDYIKAEKDLMRAVLRNAIDDYLGNNVRCRNAVERYFRSDNPTYLYSFVSICNNLEISAEMIRKYLGIN